MAIKKSELYSHLWASCDELRGSMDSSQYKDYVLVMLFIKYASDKYAGRPYAPIKIPEGASFADMVALKGKADIGDQINKKIIGPLERENSLLTELPDFANENKLGSGKEMVDRLTKLIAIFENPALDFSRNRADGDDILGDAYEYLMRNFATESGKSKGQFYTPSEVSRIIAKVLGIADANTTSSTTVYDPTCGSGSLLLKVGDEAGGNVTLNGQEKDGPTVGLAYMNMILHNYPTAVIKQGNTLANPQYVDGEALKTFDYVVANPPFSDKRWSTGLNPTEDRFRRFESYGVPPTKQGDYAYLLHIIRSLKSTGKGACILPHGVLFRGNAEAGIREKLVRKGFIKGIIGLPANLFYGTGIPACILVLDKQGAQEREGIFMIDASEGFMKDGAKNRLRSMDLHKIVDAFIRQLDLPGYSRFVRNNEIIKNEYNLNIPRYIDSSKAEDAQNIEGHLRGGIPEKDVDALAEYWKVCPTLRKALFQPNRDGFLDLAIDKSEIKASINEHPEFMQFAREGKATFDCWQAHQATELRKLDVDCLPKQIVHEVSEDLLAHFTDKPLIEKYQVYQHFMDYWSEVMQDDCYLIAADGWVAKPERILVKDKNGNEKDKGWACDLVPKELIVARYFAEEQAAIDTLTAKQEAAAAELTELEEEHSGEEGALNGVGNKNEATSEWMKAVADVWQQTEPESYAAYETAKAAEAAAVQKLAELSEAPQVSILANAKGKITQGAVNARIKESIDAEEIDLLQRYLDTAKSINPAKKKAKELFDRSLATILKRVADEPDNEDFADVRVLDAWLKLTETISELKSRLKEAEAALDKLALEKYPQLSVDEIKVLVVDDKWLGTLSQRISGEIDRVSQALTQRVRELAERYESTLPLLTQSVSELENKVNAHLEKMGFSWN